MSLMTWTEEEFGTQISTADSQHQDIFDAVNDLHDAVHSGDQASSAEKLDALANIVAEHFRTEEAWMSNHGYPGFQEHKADHDSFLAEIGSLQEKVKGGGEVTAAAAELARDWLTRHIPKVDREYGPFLSEKGVS